MLRISGNAIHPPVMLRVVVLLSFLPLEPSEATTPPPFIHIIVLARYSSSYDGETREQFGSESSRTKTLTARLEMRKR